MTTTPSELIVPKAQRLFPMGSHSKCPFISLKFLSGQKADGTWLEANKKPRQAFPVDYLCHPVRERTYLVTQHHELLERLLVSTLQDEPLPASQSTRLRILTPGSASFSAGDSSLSPALAHADASSEHPFSRSFISSLRRSQQPPLRMVREVVCCIIGGAFGCLSHGLHRIMNHVK